MLEHFLRPFLKTRNHDRSAHTFSSSHIFLEIPEGGGWDQKGPPQELEVGAYRAPDLLVSET